MPREHIHFVTGKLAEPSLRQVVERLAQEAQFDYSIDVLGISVAALMTTQWVAPRLHVPPQATRVMLPGYCRGELAPLAQQAGKPVERGPKDLRELPGVFGRPPPADYGGYDIEIIAEINHAPRLTLAEILRQAAALKADGADVIDVGCDPGDPWPGVGDCVRALRDVGHRVSIDSYHPVEIAAAAKAGAELVLSVNATNRQHAADWGCEVVAVPDAPTDLDSLDATLEVLERQGVRYRIDPILEPIGFGFAASLHRAWECRRRWPDCEMLLGIGNLTELTDADSAGLNVVLLAYCQELGIRSVLTTQVINWARSAVKECDLARRLVYHAVQRRTLPKHLEPRLVMLRDPAPLRSSPEEIAALARRIRDHNYRILLAEDGIHLVSAGLDLRGDDPFEIFAQLLEHKPKNLDASHAFYLGYEMAKALTALTLGKDYRQDEALSWGFLTRQEISHRQQRLEDSQHAS